MTREQRRQVSAKMREERYIDEQRKGSYKRRYAELATLHSKWIKGQFEIKRPKEGDNDG